MELKRLGIPIPESALQNDPKKPENMVQYETFESSSGDDEEKCMFESQALSFQNKDKRVATSQEKDQKRTERLKRKERKVNEKLKVKKETARQDRRKERLKLQLDSIQPDELDDDVIHFKDSDRDSVLSYFIKNGGATAQ